ncbi:MAG: GNAT family N-acetyltransferase [Phycisphaerales bacterium]|nr:MAG: GNAT family N-acetyltransferase [Phycisphaerales bacterium]
MAELIIRQAKDEDLTALTELWWEMTEFHRHRDEYFTMRSDGREIFGRFLFDRIQSDEHCILIAERSGETIGFCLAFVADYPPPMRKRRYGLISDLAVTAAHRRTGVGEALLEKARGWFAARGIDRLEARVAVSNETSTAFWRKAGFSTVLETMVQELPQQGRRS